MAVSYPIEVHVTPQLAERNRLTVLFRFFLAIPHVLLVGGPFLALCIGLDFDDLGFASNAGLLGAVASFATVIAWFAILLTGRHPNGLWQLAAYFVRWRVRSLAYVGLLRDEYPPFGDGDYPAGVALAAPPAERDHVTVFLRLVLAIPHFLLLFLIGMLWGLSTALAWFVILLTGRYPEPLYGFALGALAWHTRVEAYVLLLTDEYPPFTLRV